MKTKKLGTLVELDPTKKYIMLIDASVITEEEARKISIKNGMIFYGEGITEGVSFVQYSDNIVEIKIKK